MTPRHKVQKENLEFSLRLCDSAVKKYFTQRRKVAKKKWKTNNTDATDLHSLKSLIRLRVLVSKHIASNALRL